MNTLPARLTFSLLLLWSGSLAIAGADDKAQAQAKTPPLSEEAVAAAAAKIDALVEQGCAKNQITMNEPVSDEVFVRRAYLDLIGRIPTVTETRAFLDSDYGQKRARLITDLMESEGRVSHAYNFWADILRVNEELGTNARANESAYRLWIKDSLRQNKPYDRMVHELVSATGHFWENGAVGYYQRDRGMPLDNMANTVRIFLGTRLECAQCHDHPFDKWKQMDFFRMAAYSNGMDANRYQSPNRQALAGQAKQAAMNMREEKMAGLRKELQEKYGKDREAIRAAMREEMAGMEGMAKKDAKNKKGKDSDMRRVLNELYKPLRYTTVVELDKTLKLPHDYQYDDAAPESAVSARTMFGAAAVPAGDGDKIEAYAEWMTSPENPTFTRVIVNRLWKQLFGAALIEPLDELMDHTQASNPELLAHLEGLMRGLKYDMREFTRVVANTRAYQRAATTQELELGAPYHFQGPLLRRLTAEQVWDSLLALMVEDPERYKPTVKGEIGQIESVKQMYESLEGLPFDEYRALLVRLAASTGEQTRKLEETRKAAVKAREAGEDEKARELGREVRTLQGQLERTMRAEAFAGLEKGADEAELMARFGMTDELLEDTALEAARLEAPKPVMPEGLSRQERRAWMQAHRGELGRPGQKARPNAKPEGQGKGKGRRGDAKEAGVGTLARASEIQARPGSFLRTFGQSDREVIENASHEATVPQALELLNGPVTAAVVSPGSLLARELNAAADPGEKIGAIYTALLSRQPTDAERGRLVQLVQAEGEEAYSDIVWALLNGSQFLFVQ